VNRAIQELGEQHGMGFMLTLGRIGPLFVLAPLFSSRMVPVRARMVAALALAIGLSPLAMRGQELPTELLPFVGLMMKEILVGLAFSYAIAALFAAVSTAGSFLDTQIGFSFGSLVDPVNNQQSGILTQLYGLVGAMVFVVIGGDAWLIRGLAKTYETVSLTQMPDIGVLAAGAAHVFGSIFLAAIAVSAPVLLAVIITDAAFGVVSRVMPQLNVFAVGFPAKILVGFLLIGASLPFVAGWIGDQLTESVSDALKTLQVA
jgi:flagellar biosynthetic protein FliR